ncbi:hypothetical protein KC799_15865 [candidate division KSB1 bacterium]|nr:hypothetical protein [candidate division KSB1 bacterium]
MLLLNNSTDKERDGIFLRRIAIFCLVGCVQFLLPSALAAQSYGPPFIPTQGTFRVLAVFVQFQDDTWDDPCPSDSLLGWPSNRHSIPKWALGEKFLAPKKAKKYSEGSLSDYFAQMSNEQFHFIGDVFPILYLTPQPFAFYTDKTKHGRGFLSTQIIDWLDENGVDFSRYDNDNDGDVDFILFLYRHWQHKILTPGTSYQGISGFGFSKSITKDNKRILGRFPGSGTMQRGNYTLPTCRSIVTHEISHYFFGAGHYSSIGEFGIHDGNAFCYAMSGYEREKLGWIHPIEIKRDTLLSIPDAITTNTYYKIDLPNSSDYFLLENRQRISIFEKGDCVEGELPARGLMIAHIRPRASKAQQITWIAADSTFSENDKGEASDALRAGDSIILKPLLHGRSDTAHDQLSIQVRVLRQKANRVIVRIKYKPTVNQ